MADGRIYVPDAATLAASQLTDFMRFCASHTGRAFADAASFHAFSVGESARFWRLFLDWSGLICEGDAEPVCTGRTVEDTVFFPNLRLSYAENVLWIRSPSDGDRPALTACHEGRPPERFTRRELRAAVERCRVGLQRLGLKAGDRVVAIAANNAEAVISALAALSLGATFSAAAPEMGPTAILSRFRQLAPTLLMCGLRATGSADGIAILAASLPTLRAIVALDDGATGQLGVPVVRLHDLLETPAADQGPFPSFGFNHPLFILFTSGTTGAPKCIVHGAGGTLIEHVKEHRLHCDLRPGDKLLFQTSCAWMMWNWQLSALASGTEVVLFDGPIARPGAVWELVAGERVTVFGTNPAYLRLCQDSGFSPGRELSLDSLRAVLSTGSILYDQQYDWVCDHVKRLPLQSISGGTDIIGCFVLGNPNLPVHRGEAQCRSLGYDVQAWTDRDRLDGRRGELVCRNAFPSRPLGFFGDADGGKFHAAYFSQHAGAWTHGDVIEFSDHGGARLHGRTDGVLNVRGIRIGPAEIYQVLQHISEIGEALAVEQATPGYMGDSRLVLLVVLRRGATVTGELTRRIKRDLSRHASPAHVPEVIVQVSDLPVTHSGKRSERAACEAVNGRPVKNREALRNPDCLEEIRNHPALAHGTYTASPAAMAGQSLEQQIQAIWERLLSISPVMPDDNFFELGGHSLMAFVMSCEIRRLTGRDLPLATIIRAPTLGTLTHAVLTGEAEAFSCLVPLKADGEGTPLFLVHGLYGNVLDLKRLADLLVTPRPIYALQALGLDPKRQPHQRVEDMAEHYLREIRTVHPCGPYALAGHSFGGLVAFEMAQRIQREGQTVELVGLFDTDVSEHAFTWREWARFEGRRIVRIYRAAAVKPPRERLGFVLRTLVRRHAPAPRDGAVASHELPAHFRAVEIANDKAVKGYRPRFYPGRVAFFRARRREPRDPLPLWRRVTAHLDVYDVPGSHMALLNELSSVTVLANQLSGCLEGRRYGGCSALEEKPAGNLAAATVDTPRTA